MSDKLSITASELDARQQEYLVNMKRLLAKAKIEIRESIMKANPDIPVTALKCIEEAFFKQFMADAAEPFHRVNGFMRGEE